MAVISNEEIRDVSVVIFLGLVIKITPVQVGLWKEELISTKRNYDGMNLCDAEKKYTSEFRNSISFADFEKDFFLLICVAEKCLISSRATYEAFVEIVSVCMFEVIFDETEHEREYDKVKYILNREIVFNIALTLFKLFLLPSFAENVETEDGQKIKRACREMENSDHIFEYILLHKDNIINIEKHCDNVPFLIEIFKTGGITDDQKIKEYLEFFIAFKFYRLCL